MTWFQIDSNNTHDFKSNLYKKSSLMAMVVDFDDH